MNHKCAEALFKAGKEMQEIENRLNRASWRSDNFSESYMHLQLARSAAARLHKNLTAVLQRSLDDGS